MVQHYFKVYINGVMSGSASAYGLNRNQARKSIVDSIQQKHPNKTIELR